ncbi:MAG TPA: SDR family oxidoreductase [Blastocatellia bacterium]|jgi:UDP-glucose 4-epimerase|nr:SDR family oxidoreductase [Blastocatellia bacterium]
MQKTYLVTGGAGFIGSHIVERLAREGHRVRVLDNLFSGKEANVQSISGDVELLRADIRDASSVAAATDGVDVVFHEAALGSVPRSVADPRTTHEVNLTGTLNVLLAARDARVRRVVYASSSSVYGETAVLPKHEELIPQPLSPYALSKLAAEHYIKIFHRVYGLEAVSLRYFNIFGPRQDPESEYAAVVPRFVTALLEGERPVIYGDGLQSRDFTYVENVVNANLLAAEAEGVAGEVFNVACGGRYTLLDLLTKLKDAIGSDIEAIHEPARAGDVRDSQASVDKATKRLGYQVSVDFEEGLRKTVEWYREQSEK